MKRGNNMPASTNRQSYRDLPIEIQTDPIFFHKSQVSVGARFRHKGRLNPGTTWVLQRIWTMKNEKYGRVRMHVVSVQKLDDILELRCEETGEERSLRFVYSSYSSIWQLEEQ